MSSSPRCRSVRIAIGLALLLLAGCDDTVRVFQPEVKPLPIVLASGQARANVITVSPVRGLPEPLGRELAEAMLRALERRSLPVMLHDGDESGVLYGVSGRYQPQIPGSDAMALTWEVRDAQGQLVGRHVQLIPIGFNPLDPGARARLLADIAKESATMMAKGIEGDAPVPSDSPLAAATRAADDRSVVIGDIMGAPGKEGDNTLRQAIAYALKVANLRVVDRKTSDNLTVTGAVKTEEIQAGVRHVKVTWSVLKSDGKALGQVSQENNVPAQLLERVWGEIAATVAQNAAGGIAAIVSEADRAAVTE